MVKQKKHTHITQSGKNYTINCTIQGARLIWKQKISLVLTKPYCSLANEQNFNDCVISTVLHFFHWCIFALVLHISHSFLSQSGLSNLFLHIINNYCITHLQVAPFWSDFGLKITVLEKLNFNWFHSSVKLLAMPSEAGINWKEISPPCEICKLD